MVMITYGNLITQVIVMKANPRSKVCCPNSFDIRDV